MRRGYPADSTPSRCPSPLLPTTCSLSLRASFALSTPVLFLKRLPSSTCDAVRWSTGPPPSVRAKVVCTLLSTRYLDSCDQDPVYMQQVPYNLSQSSALGEGKGA
eukprot:6193989-Pleurochrysis_carterae.AAC.1